jgi:phage baseplate assembly protein W
MSTYAHDKAAAHGRIRGLWNGRIASNPTDPNQRVNVTVNAFASSLLFGPCRWQARDATSLPRKGDACLVAFEDGDPHFSLPFRFARGAAVVVEQDSPAEIADCVQAILRYTPGSRLELPTFGLPDQAFLQGGADAEQVTAAIAQWEPRADATVTVQADTVFATVSDVTVEVRPRKETP